MHRARYTQRNLFDQAIPARALQPDLRTKLAPLLQALLAEAAGAVPCKIDLEKVGGDDQDHA